LCELPIVLKRRNIQHLAAGDSRENRSNVKTLVCHGPFVCHQHWTIIEESTIQYNISDLQPQYRSLTNVIIPQCATPSTVLNVFFAVVVAIYRASQFPIAHFYVLPVEISVQSITMQQFENAVKHIGKQLAFFRLKGTCSHTIMPINNTSYNAKTIMIHTLVTVAVFAFYSVSKCKFFISSPVSSVSATAVLLDQV
jgi:hypothetical protein